MPLYMIIYTPSIYDMNVITEVYESNRNSR